MYIEQIFEAANDFCLGRKCLCADTTATNEEKKSDIEIR